VANHLTPSELADEMNMKPRDVISKCMEMNVPIFNGRIDKTLFLSNLRQIGKGAGTPQAAA
jgi:Translation initiation factor IF-2, N-terminal region